MLESNAYCCGVTEVMKRKINFDVMKEINEKLVVFGGLGICLSLTHSFNFLVRKYMKNVLELPRTLLRPPPPMLQRPFHRHCDIQVVLPWCYRVLIVVLQRCHKVTDIVI
jgi:hypothetical protein